MKIFEKHKCMISLKNIFAFKCGYDDIFDIFNISNITYYCFRPTKLFLCVAGYSKCSMFHKFFSSFCTDIYQQQQDVLLRSLK